MRFFGGPILNLAVSCGSIGLNDAALIAGRIRDFGGLTRLPPGFSKHREAKVKSLSKDRWQAAGVEILLGEKLSSDGIGVGLSDHHPQGEMEMSECVTYFTSK